MTKVLIGGDLVALGGVAAAGVLRALGERACHRSPETIADWRRRIVSALSAG